MHGRASDPAEDVGPGREQARLGMPLVRLQAFPRHLHAASLGREAHPPPGVQALREAHDDLGEVRCGVRPRGGMEAGGVSVSPVDGSEWIATLVEHVYYKTITTTDSGRMPLLGQES